MIHELSVRLANKLTDKNTVREDYSYSDRVEIMAYGIECLITTSIPIIFYLILSAIMNIFLPMLIWLFSFLLLRNYIGGFHASTNFRCIFLSTVIGILCLILIKQFSYNQIIISPIIVFTFYSFFLLLNLILKPIISISEMKTPMYQKKYMLISTIVLCTLGVLSAVLEKPLLTISFSIAVGVFCAETLFIIQHIIKKGQRINKRSSV